MVDGSEKGPFLDVCNQISLCVCSEGPDYVATVVARNVIATYGGQVKLERDVIPMQAETCAYCDCDDDNDVGNIGAVVESMVKRHDERSNS